MPKILTQGALDAGAAGVIEVAKAAGFGSMISMDQARGLAAVVIRRADVYREVHEDGRHKPAAAAPLADTADAGPQSHFETAVHLLRGLFGKK